MGSFPAVGLPVLGRVGAVPAVGAAASTDAGGNVRLVLRCCWRWPFDALPPPPGGGLFFAVDFISEAFPPSRLGGSAGRDRGTRGL